MMMHCDYCGLYENDCVCGHNTVRSEWSWVSDDDDTNIGIRAKGLTGSGRSCDQDGNRVCGNKGKSVETDYGEDDIVRSGKCGRAAEEDEYAQGKPTMRTGKSPTKKFPKKVFQKGFVKKSGKKSNAPVGRPRKPGIRCFKCKEFGHIASICPSKYIKLSPLPIESDYIVKDTCGGKWDSIWVVDPTFKTHMTGNRNMFKCFKRHFGVVTNESRKDFSFVHGIGEVRVPVDGKDKTIPCVSYAPSLDKNVLSLEQLLFQGIETVTMGDTCVLKKMFGCRSKGFDIYEDKSEVDLEQDYLNAFYDNLGIDNGYKKEKKEFQECLGEYYEREFEKAKNKKKVYGEHSKTRKKEVVYSKKAKKALLIYIEGEKDNPRQSRETLRERALILSQLEEDVVERNMIMESCVEPGDLITLHEEIKKHQRFFDAPFEEVLVWFITDFLGIVCEKAMPPELIDGRDLSLILLHRIVKHNGGFKEVMEKNMWDVIAAKYGYEPDDAYEMKVAYIYYLELVEWYFDYMKKERERKEDGMAGNSSNNCGWLDESSDDDVVVKIEVTNNRKE
ncbi:putative transcription factor interactor and regulator CCHC(Zn) family [Helianthus annuus]|nr:putative transcription factor interactor and regulator CCHC(Zn) family [Helianthus annuus]